MINPLKKWVKDMKIEHLIGAVTSKTMEFCFDKCSELELKETKKIIINELKRRIKTP